MHFEIVLLCLLQGAMLGRQLLLSMNYRRLSFCQLLRPLEVGQTVESVASRRILGRIGAQVDQLV